MHLERATAVTFDLDDTLVDHTAAARAAITGFLADRGWRADAAVADRWITLERQHFAAYVAGHVEFSEHRRRRLRGILEHVGADRAAALPDDAMDAEFMDYRDRYVLAWRPFDDAVPALRRLSAAGIVVAVLTNGQPGQQHDKLERTGLAPYVELLLTVADVPAPKPDTRAFSTLCDRLATVPADVLYVGDDLAVDIAGANGAGLRAVHLDRTGTAAPGDQPRIRTLDELAVSPSIP